MIFLKLNRKYFYFLGTTLVLLMGFFLFRMSVSKSTAPTQSANHLILGDSNVHLVASIKDSILPNPDRTFYKFSDQNKIINRKSSVRGGLLVPVLMYHYVGDLPANPDSVRRDLTVSSVNFANQMNYLASRGFHTISMSELYQALTDSQKLPSKPVLITFDDGYKETLDITVPILFADHFTGSFAIITGFVGGRDYASWQEISGAESENMEIVSHSYSHIDFASPKYNYSDKLENIAIATSDFKNRLGIDPKFFIYPYGHHDADTEKILRDEGFLMAFTTNYGLVHKGLNLLELPRVRVHGSETLNRFIQLLAAN